MYYDFVSMDFSNIWQLDKYIKRKQEQITELMKSAEYNKVYQEARWFAQHDKQIYSVILDIMTIRGDETEYFLWLEAAFKKGFDPTDYERSTDKTKYLNSEKYKEIKEKLFNKL